MKELYRLIKYILIILLSFSISAGFNMTAFADTNKNTAESKKEIDNATIQAILDNPDIELTEAQIAMLESMKKPESLFCKEQIEILQTFVEVSTEFQHLWYYKDGQLLFDCPVTTGKKGHETNIGIQKIKNKARNATLVGPDYRSFVKYWMGFNKDGEGFHDASWRKKFGTTTYLRDGSHGCVNMPEEYAVMLYNNIEVGCMVYIY